MTQHKTIFTTERGQFHQELALAAAPDSLEITMLRQPDRATLMQHLAEAEFLISERSGVIDAEMLQAAPKLQFILRIGSMTFDIDLEAAKQAEVNVCYWPTSTTIHVAEHVIMQMLALGKRLREIEPIALAASEEWGESQRTDEDTFAYNWSGRRQIATLWGETVGIMGFGEIGGELARRLQGWGCQFIYCKREPLPDSLEAEWGLTFVDHDTLMRQSDFVVNLLPYFPDTNQLIDASYFAKMKSGAFFISCGSGSVVDEAALAEAIKSGRLAGAAVDTYEWEPLKPDNPLLPLAKSDYNVLLTPHTAAGSGDYKGRSTSRADEYTNIVNYLTQQPLLYQVA